MKESAVLLREYLNSIGFNTFYKYLAGITAYFLTPFRFNEKSELNSQFIETIIPNGPLKGIIKCLVLSEMVFYDSLDIEEKQIADELIEVGLIVYKGGKIYNAGYQLISYNGLYLLTNGGCSYSHTEYRELYLGVDSYFMIYYLDTKKIDKNSKCLDMCTGTGVSALYLSNFSDNVIGTDIAELPLKISQFNCILNNKELSVLIKNEDFNITINNEEKYDIITCNPPFVAFPQKLNAPIFAVGCDKDGLGFYRLLFNRLNHILTLNGFACFVSDLMGDEKQPYFINELEELSKKHGMDINVFIDSKIPVINQIENFPYGIIRRYNIEYSINEIKDIFSDFILNEMKTKYYYLSTIVVNINSNNPKLTVYNRFKQSNKYCYDVKL